MQFNEDFGLANTHIIKSYQPGQITVNQHTYTASLIVSANRILNDWPARTLADLNPTNLAVLLEFNPDVVIIGVENSAEFPDSSLLGLFQSKGIGLEVMSTAAACRTYNVLLSEGRKVVAALLLDK